MKPPCTCGDKRDKLCTTHISDIKAAKRKTQGKLTSKSDKPEEGELVEVRGD